MILAPAALLLAGVLLSMLDADAFLAAVTNANDWILRNFSDAFNLGSFAFVLTIVWVWFSPLGRVKIGGAKAVPLLSRWNWFAITLCTTIAIGILFWATAEPLLHYHEPPGQSGIDPASAEARRFAISSLFMHWSLTPYAIYSVPALAFALAHYNLGKGFSLYSPISLVFGQPSNDWVPAIVDALAVFALVAGLAASLGVGILSISSGVAVTFDIAQSPVLLGLVAFSIISVFTLSSVSGLTRGIKWLSDWNVRFFFLLCAILIFVGPTGEMLSNGMQGLGDYVREFLPRSIGQGVTADQGWSRSWTSFYWANWLAWAPITALFLGRISRGYSVREFIVFNMLLPSLFAIVWMSIFGVSALAFDAENGSLYAALQADGPESVIYSFFEFLPFPAVWSAAFIGLSFICFVTAADSNTDAVSNICQKSESRAEGQATTLGRYVKILWGILIGVTAWIMVSFSGVDGVRMLSNLGGLPALFIVAFMNVAIILMGTRRYSDLRK